MDLKELAQKAHSNAKEKGFWEGEKNFLEALMLVTSELGEAAEAYRKDDWNNVKEELADVMIRIMDLAHGFGINIEEEIIKKMEFNKARPYKHNKKV